MASIRIPSIATDILPFCNTYAEPVEAPCFDNYAQMIVVAACLGYRLEEGHLGQRCDSFLKSPNPIDLAIFRSQNLFNQLLIISMLSYAENEKALNESNLIQVIESFAERGLTEMSSALSASGPALFPNILSQWMIDPPALQI